MAGELVPLVMIPRYTTYSGDSTFTSIAMDVSEYQKAIVNVWRGKLIGTSPTYNVSFQESTDQDSWTVCTNGSGGDPGSETEAQYTPTLAKRWFRIVLTLAGTGPIVSTWAIGFLEMRQS